MKKYTLLALVVVFAFLIGCTVGFETTGADNEFSCEDTEDCLPGYTCQAAVCKRSGLENNANCDDPDGDGYSVGDARSNCPLCADEGKCEEDCAPNDPNINPGAGEICNGADDNCNEDIDESIMCTTSSDCGTNPADLEGDAAVPGVVWRCEAGACVAQMRKTICSGGAPPDCGCNSETLSCNAGAYPSVPEACQ